MRDEPMSVSASLQALVTALMRPALNGLFQQINQEIQHMDARVQTALAALRAKVEANGNAEASAIALLKGLAQQLKDLAATASPDDIIAGLADLGSAVDAQATNLAAAVTANTPAQGGTGGTPSTEGSATPDPA
jgi:predicted TIM-barrel enzyme